MSPRAELSAPGPLASWAGILLVLGLCLLAARSQVDPPRGAAGTGWQESAGRATLSALLAENVPHPVGTPENAVVRDRILERLKRDGYAPEVDARFHCLSRARGSGCAQLENIVAVKRGAQSGPAVLVTTHYDSVPAGPGASDAASGVAILLHLAEALKERPTRNDVIFLFTDAEEVGMRGAAAFAAHDPRFARVASVVNVEARGGGGPSYMFETGPGASKLMALYATAAPRPVTSSLAYEVYKILPNDTDFSIYREAGRIGFNLAFVGHASVYHSREDRPENLDPDTFQHHGDTVFALAQALADADLAALKSTHDASYFDVGGRFLAIWPNAWNAPLSGIAFVLILAAIWRTRSHLGPARIAFAAAATIAAPIVLFAVGWALSFPLAVWPGAATLDHPAPWPGRVALLAGLSFATLSIAAIFARAAGWRALMLVGWTVIGALAVAAALFLPGGAYAFLWPALVFGLLAAFFGERAWGLIVAGAIAAAFAGFFWVNHFLALEVVLGFPQSAARLGVLAPIAWAAMGLLASALAPAGRSAWAALGVAALSVAAPTALAAAQPGATPNRPYGVNFVYLQDATSPARWLAQFEGRTDRNWAGRNGFSEAPPDARGAGGARLRGLVKDATPMGLAPPRFELQRVENIPGGQRYVGVITPGQGGASLRIASDPSTPIETLSVEDQTVWADRPAGASPGRSASIAGVGARPLRVTLTFATRGAAGFYLVERSALPETAESRALIAARPPNSAPIHAGDAAVVTARIDLAQTGDAGSPP